MSWGMPKYPPVRQYFHINYIAEFAVWGANLLTSPVAGRCFLTGFLVPYGFTMYNVAVEVGTASGGSTARIGLYSESTKWNPKGGKLIKEFGTISGATTGVKNLTDINLPLSAGRYFICAECSDGVLELRRLGSTRYDMIADSQGSMLRGAWFDQTFGPLPATIPNTVEGGHDDANVIFTVEEKL